MISDQRKLENGFTIVELLLVIAIIGVLTTLALGVMQGATNDAKVAATQVRIQQVEAIMLKTGRYSLLTRHGRSFKLSKGEAATLFAWSKA